jgi:hypothetical protein
MLPPTSIIAAQRAARPDESGRRLSSIDESPKRTRQGRIRSACRSYKRLHMSGQFGLN